MNSNVRREGERERVKKRKEKGYYRFSVCDSSDETLTNNLLNSSANFTSKYSSELFIEGEKPFDFKAHTLYSTFLFFFLAHQLNRNCVDDPNLLFRQDSECRGGEEGEEKEERETENTSFLMVPSARLFLYL